MIPATTLALARQEATEQTAWARSLAASFGDCARELTDKSRLFRHAITLAREQAEFLSSVGAGDEPRALVTEADAGGVDALNAAVAAVWAAMRGEGPVPEMPERVSADDAKRFWAVARGKSTWTGMGEG